MKIVIVPSGFKECLDAEDVALAMERGVKCFDPSIDMEVIPMIDGGEGFAKAITNIKGGELIYKEVVGPVGEKIQSHFGIFVENGKRTAVIEMAAVAGLKLVPRNQRNPLKTTTHGVGELILSALDIGVDRILIGCGIRYIRWWCRNGAGVRVQFFDKNHQLVHINGGKDLLKVDYLDLTHLNRRLQTVAIDVACNWQNVSCGEQGVARVFGPQKGATSKQVEKLSSALR